MLLKIGGVVAGITVLTVLLLGGFLFRTTSNCQVFRDKDGTGGCRFKFERERPGKLEGERIAGYSMVGKVLWTRYDKSNNALEILLGYRQNFWPVIAVVRVVDFDGKGIKLFKTDKHIVGYPNYGYSGNILTDEKEITEGNGLVLLNREIVFYSYKYDGVGQSEKIMKNNQLIDLLFGGNSVKLFIANFIKGEVLQIPYVVY